MLLVIMQQADQGSVMSKLIKVSVRMGTSTTISVQYVQEWGQNTSLRSACVGGAYVRGDLLRPAVTSGSGSPTAMKPVSHLRRSPL